MIREQARVIAIHSGRMVLAPGGGDCASCGAAGDCGSAALARLLPRARRELVLPLQAGCRVGDTVELALPESSLPRAAAKAYLPPLAGLVLGAVAISPAGESLQPLGGLLGMLAGFAAARMLSRLSSIPWSLASSAREATDDPNTRAVRQELEND